MSKMQAVLIKDGKGPIENLYIGEAEKPVPIAGQVLVEVKAFGLNRADLIQREGNYPPPPGASPIMGLEFSGLVVELGPDVNEWSLGDEVFGLVKGGAYAEYINCDQRLLMKKPSYLSWAEAASIPENFITAYQALVKVGELQKDDNVLVHAGASGVGVAAIQIARVCGSKTVTATASTSEKLKWLQSVLRNGPTHVANYKTQDFAAEVKKTTEGKGVDVLIDFVGQSHWHKNIDSLAIDGRMTMLATLSGNEVSSVNLSSILYKRLRIQGSTLRGRTTEYQADLIADFKRDIVDKISGEDGDGPIRTYIHSKYAWTDIQNAQREMAANKNSGKIIAEISCKPNA
ncbi:quinone oxidoreductase putative [Hygrophoropsis aurantiaca]|uniref:Quinone oxidoreductase putative n=1 Tax=Hygrophoropsis aurantiaca TaxID=72124 RepID=A0ACB8AL02_9AGAM|nr:quinone oxidoreductase putative [Hygrophoropsis aurantiaca]